jgi:demethylmenaquinone methyltransferase/2-methoxy-6-polyprenyl-1,4-benzoquinol methylase
MFAGIAPRYDLGNRVLSLGLDQAWRRLAVRRSGVGQGMAVLDCAAGTGDLSLAFKQVLGATGRVAALDFCSPMLELLESKARQRGLEIETVLADMQDLPFAAGSFDCVSCAFGIRNVDAPERALREMARVLRPGGRIVILETGQPDSWLAPLYRGYTQTILPWLGGMLSGNRAACSYLQRSSSLFPFGAAFVTLLRSASPCAEIQAWPLSGGVVWLYVACLQ